MRPEAEHPASVGVAPRGWYPDPEDPSRWGYWNGKRWTERTRPSRGADHPIARGVIGGLMCLYGIPLLWERGGAVGGTVLLFAGLPLFFSAFSGPTQRPLRWFSASLDLLVGGAFAAAGTVAAGAMFLDGDPMGLFAVFLAAPVAFALFFLGLTAIRDLRSTRGLG
jgi:hypothetical protein